MKLGNYKNLNLEKEEIIKVTPEEVENELNALLANGTTLVSKEGKSENGDTVNIDFEGFVDGVSFEGGKGEHYDLELGSHSFIPGFEEQLIGYESGSEVDVNVTFPENYQAENLKGKAAVFKCKIHEVKTRKTPELNDEFAKSYGLETVEELRKALEDSMNSKRENEVLNKYLETLLSHLAATSEVEYASEELDAKIEEALNYYERQMMSYGATLDSYLKMSGMSKEMFIEQMKPEAILNLKIEKIVEEIKILENLEASEEDIERHLGMLKASYRLSDEQVEEFKKDRLEEFKKEVSKQNVLTFLIKNN